MSGLLTLDNTALVLDSTADPCEGYFDRPGIFMVPLKVHFGDETYRDGVDMDYKEFFAKLEASEVLPTTSQPTVGEFTAAYTQAREKYEHVFSLLAEKLELEGVHVMFMVNFGRPADKMMILSVNGEKEPAVH